MLTDDELIAGFEAGTLTDFPHAAHVRLTLAYLARHGRDETLRRLLDGLRRFAEAKGHPEKFHVTMTRAWLEAISATRGGHPELAPEALVAACPELLNRDLLLRFYSPERLHSDEARTRWMPPDRARIAGI